MDVVDENVPNPFETTSMMWERNLDIRDAEPGTAGRAVLVEEAGCGIQVVNGVRIDDGECFLEEGVAFIAVLDRFRILVERERGKIRRILRLKCVGLVRNFW